MSSITTLTYPFTENAVRRLNAGESVLISGKVFTGRDRLHKFFASGGNLGVDFTDGGLYHCGPVVKKTPAGWEVVAAGPTTSCRENPYEPDFIAKTGVRVIIGKGGMDENVLSACRKYGAVYLQAAGGAGALAAAAVAKVKSVKFLDEFGAAEACWEFEFKSFPAVVAMDAKGVSLFEKVRRDSAKALQKVFEGRFKG